MRSLIFLSFVFAALASNVVILDATNFDVVVDGSKHVFVEFFAPW
jgi:protein disulfide-isomerase A6